MATPPTPRMRPLELMPAGRAEEGTFLLRDPEGFAQPAVVPLGAAMLITLMDGRRSLSEQTRFHDEWCSSSLNRGEWQNRRLAC